VSTIAVVPGSFDPVTLGHLDIMARTAELFDEVHVLVVHNPAKTAFFELDERMRLIEEAIADAGIQGTIRVESLASGLLVDYTSRVGATALVKGLRSANDVDYETPMAHVNRDLGGIETLFLLPAPKNSYLSSSLVRQVASLGGDVTPYVPPVVERALAERHGHSPS